MVSENEPDMFVQVALFEPFYMSQCKLHAFWGLIIFSVESVRYSQ